MEAGHGARPLPCPISRPAARHQGELLTLPPALRTPSRGTSVGVADPPLITCVALGSRLLPQGHHPPGQILGPTAVTLRSEAAETGADDQTSCGIRAGTSSCLGELVSECPVGNLTWLLPLDVHYISVQIKGNAIFGEN
ncbi:hypothetical protein NDU88_007187 [Pleurodeles waltl]|uniref:Uncharacterized protein n=1 Tax=Pleurodeles waltl TaxID=8319 RepID=A0AAV7N316_PLEWA|nr:hypothetical protein NDU88_007187 [Pleurodeles waltl]